METVKYIGYVRGTFSEKSVCNVVFGTKTFGTDTGRNTNAFIRSNQYFAQIRNEWIRSGNYKKLLYTDTVKNILLDSIKKIVYAKKSFVIVPELEQFYI